MGMAENIFWRKIVHIVGIKGTGCAALVGILLRQHCRVTGSDGPESFYTSQMLDELGVSYSHSFSAGNIGADVDFVIYSPAYGDENPEIQEAKRRNLPLLSYPEALGRVSAAYFSVAVAGVHGKTTTSALCGVIAKILNREYGLGASVLVGSGVPAFRNQSVFLCEGDIFIAETCEYRRHFLHFSPDVIIITSVEWDHQDYFVTPQDIELAFLQLCEKLPKGGQLICCVDDSGVRKLLPQLQISRPDVLIIPYGETAQGSPWQITSHSVSHQGKVPQQECYISGWKEPFYLQIPGLHNLQNSAASLALAQLLMERSCPDVTMQEWMPYAISALANFTGTKRRAEIIGHVRDVLIMDDYGHHPTAIATTLAGIKEFYQPKRLLVSFMSHTFSRTSAQLREFAESLAYADILILHKIYASAREVFQGEVKGETLFQECQALYPERTIKYLAEPMEALPFLQNLLQPGDLFLTLGAGNNFQLSHALYKELLSCTA